MEILEFLADIDGIAQLYAANGQFLGVLSSDQYHYESINNPHGLYGSPYAANSIRNPHGVYGGCYGIYSPYNTYCHNPPTVIYQGQSVLVVTKNPYAFTNGLPIVDPDFLLGVYAQMKTSPHSADPYASSQWSLSQSTQTLAQIFNLFP